MELPARLFHTALEYHTRRGLRRWCSCEYCQAKLVGTNWIGHSSIHYSRYRGLTPIGGYSQFPGHLLAKGYDGPYWSDEWNDYVRSRLQGQRQDKRIKLRAELRELKERTL